jgi:hypothetical protein
MLSGTWFWFYVLYIVKTLEKLYLFMILLIASNLKISVKTVTKNKFIRLNIN